MLIAEPMQCWAVQVENKRCAWIVSFTVRRTRTEAIHAFVGDANKAWEWWRRRGYSAVKVTVTPTSVERDT